MASVITSLLTLEVNVLEKMSDCAYTYGENEINVGIIALLTGHFI